LAAHVGISALRGIVFDQALVNVHAPRRNEAARKGGTNLKIQIDGAYRASALSFFSRGFG
jgi:hypothetical protein